MVCCSGTVAVAALRDGTVAAASALVRAECPSRATVAVCVCDMMEIGWTHWSTRRDDEVTQRTTGLHSGGPRSHSATRTQCDGFTQTNNISNHTLH